MNTYAKIAPVIFVKTAMRFHSSPHSFIHFVNGFNLIHEDEE